MSRIRVDEIESVDKLDLLTVTDIKNTVNTVNSGNLGLSEQEVIDLLNANNYLTKTEIENLNDKKFTDWYGQGEIFTTTEELSEQDFIKVMDNTVIDEYRYPQTYSVYQNQQNKVKSRQDNFLPLDYKTTTNSGIHYIQIDDFYFFELFDNDTNIKQHKFDSQGNIVETVDKNIGPSIDYFYFFDEAFGTGGCACHDVNFITSENKNYVYYKTATDLFCYIYDYNLDQEFSYIISDYFSDSYSTVKLTEKYVYELTSNSLLRYQLPQDNDQPSGTSEVVFTTTDLSDNGFSNTFSGAADSDFYGFGEDVNIIFYEDTLKDDEVVFSNKDLTNNWMEFHRTSIPDSFTTSDILTNAVSIAYNDIKYQSFLGGRSLEIEEKATSYHFDKSFIQQLSENKLCFGTLLSRGIDPLVSSNYNVFNHFFYQTIDLNDNSLLFFEFTRYSDIFDETPLRTDSNSKYCFDIISSNKNSISFIVFEEDPDNTNEDIKEYFQTSYIINQNFVEGFYDSSNNTYNKLYDNSFYTYILRDNFGIKNKIRRQGYIDGKYDWFYNMLNSRARVEQAQDTFYSTLFIAESARVFIDFIQEGYHFKKLSDSDNINTYIKK